MSRWRPITLPPYSRQARTESPADHSLRDVMTAEICQRQVRNGEPDARVTIAKYDLREGIFKEALFLDVCTCRHVQRPTPSLDGLISTIYITLSCLQ